jgi:hypothetical protein
MQAFTISSDCYARETVGTPGYGVVESMREVRVVQGSVQQRDVFRPEFKVGNRLGSASVTLGTTTLGRRKP